ncbi:hypothetical protein [Kitasatospora sp. NPDC092286]
MTWTRSMVADNAEAWNSLADIVPLHRPPTRLLERRQRGDP